MAGMNAPGLYRKNNVLAWQRMHQNHHDGLRSWEKGPRAKMMLFPYYGLMIATTSATMYMMCRMVLVSNILFYNKVRFTNPKKGHKTWFSEN